MERYIKAKDLVDWCNEYYAKQNTIQGKEYFNAFLHAVTVCPTADVVPKSEVDFLRKTIAENAQKALEVTLEEIEKAKAEVTREIFEEIEFEIHQLDFDREETRAIAIEGIIAELKKKYTEGKRYVNSN